MRPPQPPRPPRMDDIAAHAALQGGMPIKQGPVPFQDVTPAFQYGPLKPRKEGSLRPVYKIETAMGSVYAPSFIIMRPYGWLLFSHEEDLRPFQKDNLKIDQWTIPIRADVTQLILASTEVSVTVVPGEEWMLVTADDTEAICDYLDQRLNTGQAFTLSEFLASRQSSDQSAGTEAGGESES